MGNLCVRFFTNSIEGTSMDKGWGAPVNLGQMLELQALKGIGTLFHHSSFITLQSKMTRDFSIN